MKNHLEEKFTSLTAYKLKKNIYRSEDGAYQVALYTHASGVEVIIQTYDYKKKDDLYRELHNEAVALEFLQNSAKIRSKSVKFPRLYAVVDAAGRLITIREHIKGQAIHSLSQTAKTELYLTVINALQAINANQSQLPLFTYREMASSFPGIAFKAFLKEPKLVGEIIRLVIAFYMNTIDKNDGVTDYVLTACELRPEDITVSEDTIYVTSLKKAAVCEAGTDIALFPGNFVTEIGRDTMTSFFETHLRSASALRRFMRIASYYALKQLVVLSGSSEQYEIHLKFITILTEVVLNSLSTLNKKLSADLQGVAVKTRNS